MPKKSSRKLSKRPIKKTSKRPSKKTSKRTSKRNSKKSSKRLSIKKPTISYNKIILDDMIRNANTFNSSDYEVFDTILLYRPFYEMVIRKSLEYKIDFNISNITSGQTKVDYYVKTPIYAGPYSTTMHIIGNFVGNTFLWNNYFKKTHYQTYLKYFAPYIKNSKTLLTIEKLFNLTQITFSERYKNIIPYFLSMLYDIKKANIIRFTDAGGNVFYIFIDLSIDIPNQLEIIKIIENDLNRINYMGGSKLNNRIYKNIRIIKNDDGSHTTKLNTNKITKKILDFNNNEN